MVAAYRIVAVPIGATVLVFLWSSVLRAKVQNLRYGLE